MQAEVSSLDLGHDSLLIIGESGLGADRVVPVGLESQYTATSV